MSVLFLRHFHLVQPNSLSCSVSPLGSYDGSLRIIPPPSPNLLYLLLPSRPRDLIPFMMRRDRSGIRSLAVNSIGYPYMSSPLSPLLLSFYRGMVDSRTLLAPSYPSRFSFPFLVPFPLQSPFPVPLLLLSPSHRRPLLGAWFSPWYDELDKVPGLATGAAGFLQAARSPVCRDGVACGVTETIVKQKNVAGEALFLSLPPDAGTLWSVSPNFLHPSESQLFDKGLHL